MIFGVATAGFQVEGGFNAYGQPTNNWADWELLGKAEPSGLAVRFWDRPEMLLDRAAALGVDRFRMSLEWSRIQPGFDIGDREAPPVDETALDGYARLVRAIRDRGMEPLITLLHFTHPRWAGVDLWGSGSKRPLFVDFVRLAVDGLNRRLKDPVREWVTLNEPNILPVAGPLAGAFPRGRSRGQGAAVRWLDHLYAAHIEAYDVIHDLHEAHGWGEPVVTTNHYTLSQYRLDRFFTDLLLAREHGISLDDLASWLAERERRHPSRGFLERSLGAALGRLVQVDRLPHTIDALYTSPRSRKLDVIAVDWYDPVLIRQVRRPGRMVDGRRRWSPRAGLDEQMADPPGLRAEVESWLPEGRPVMVAENGLCTRWPAGGTPQRRADGLTRIEYLRDHVPVAARAGAAAYYHWTLADNYEWGTYAPRFGLHAVKREEGHITVLDHDAQGDDAAGEYRALIASVRESGPASRS